MNDGVRSFHTKAARHPKSQSIQTPFPLVKGKASLSVSVSSSHVGATLHRRRIFPDLPPATPMEAVGARLGRSSSRYGTTTVFNGPVRKWKKKWVQVAPAASTHHTSSHTNHHSSLANGTSNSPSHLLLFKWTPISQSNKENNDTNNGENKNPSSKDDSPDSDAAPAPETPPRRKFRYVPVAALEEQQKDTEENTDDEAKATDTDTDTNAAEPTSKSDSRYENPDINDIPMDEDQDVENDEMMSGRQDLNKSTLDLSLG